MRPPSSLSLKGVLNRLRPDPFLRTVSQKIYAASMSSHAFQIEITIGTQFHQCHHYIAIALNAMPRMLQAAIPLVAHCFYQRMVRIVCPHLNGEDWLTVSIGFLPKMDLIT